MGSHEEFLELCAAATAGELSVDERARLDSHLAACQECRGAMSEFEACSASGSVGSGARVAINGRYR